MGLVDTGSSAQTQCGGSLGHTLGSRAVECHHGCAVWPCSGCHGWQLMNQNSLLSHSAAPGPAQDFDPSAPWEFSAVSIPGCVSRDRMAV